MKFNYLGTFLLFIFSSFIGGMFINISDEGYNLTLLLVGFLILIISYTCIVVIIETEKVTK